MKLENIKGFDVLDCGQMPFADAKAQAARANREAIGGYSDWVLPDNLTLMALALLYGGEVRGRSWSSSPVSGFSNFAWVVNFDVGYVNNYNRSNGDAVRLVRASQCLDIQREGGKVSLKDAGIDYET